MSRTGTQPGRRYSGLEHGERKVARRAALIAAAVELFGTRGYTTTTVKQICDRAELTQRYFYESFKDRKTCLRAVYDEIIDDVRRLTLEALENASDFEDMAPLGVSAFVEYFTADPLRAQIVMIEVVGVSPDLEERRYAVLSDFAEIVGTVWLQNVEGVDRRFAFSLAVGMVGAVNHLLVDWLLGGKKQDPVELIAVCVALFEAARARVSVPSP
ncbi:TetR/AcrR family transcriptional regulator [Rhodococcus sp. NPDC058521]|uniref:TetR/AcrR family transcriptional regulator n=1 Tax=Rhodococcus sp. NPDC058521 TaxID=3346536 RepID=UPI0036662712